MSFESLLKKAKKAESPVKCTTVRIGAAFAEAALKDFNDSNRPLSKGVSRLYANEMLRGKWECNGEPLIFSVDETGKVHLISGQHRLDGLLLCNKLANEEWPNAQTELDMVIISGVQHSTADTVDTGRSRNHADVLFRDPWVDSYFGGESGEASWNSTVARRKTWTKTLAGAARLVWLIQGGETVSSAPKFVISEMLEFIKEQHPNLANAVTMVLDANESDSGNKGLKMSLPYIAALSYVACVDENGNFNPEQLSNIDEFLNRISVGTGYDKGSPEWALAAYWNKLKAESGSKDRDRDWIGPFVKALQAFLDGSTGLKVSDIALSKKEREGYTDFPQLLPGFMTASFENAARIREARKVKPEPEAEAEPTPSPEPVKAAKRKPRKPKVVDPADIPTDDDDHDWGSGDSDTF
jgi:hypothetical protein